MGGGLLGSEVEGGQGLVNWHHLPCLGQGRREDNVTGFYVGAWLCPQLPTQT